MQGNHVCCAAAAEHTIVGTMEGEVFTFGIGTALGTDTSGLLPVLVGIQ